MLKTTYEKLVLDTGNMLNILFKTYNHKRQESKQ